MNEKIKKLRNWLRGYVVSPSTPKVVILSNFEFDLKEFKGSFRLTLDNLRFISGFSFSVDISGRYEIAPPLYVSPMGVPASYPSIELTDETNEAIAYLINEFFPKIKPLGLEKNTEKFIDRNTAMWDRVVDAQHVSWVINQITSKDFELNCSLEKLK
ncbi:hypothetical protein G6733_03560 [Polynucleobacter paneuropaeus]|nr:hypothetical protein G6733_03560 [Polynucleobacter paneuropaeus]